MQNMWNMINFHCFPSLRCYESFSAPLHCTALRGNQDCLVHVVLAFHFTSLESRYHNPSLPLHFFIFSTSVQCRYFSCGVLYSTLVFLQLFSSCSRIQLFLVQGPKCIPIIAPYLIHAQSLVFLIKQLQGLGLILCSSRAL